MSVTAGLCPRCHARLPVPAARGQRRCSHCGEIVPAARAAVPIGRPVAPPPGPPHQDTAGRKSARLIAYIAICFIVFLAAVSAWVVYALLPARHDPGPEPAAAADPETVSLTEPSPEPVVAERTPVGGKPPPLPADDPQAVAVAPALPREEQEAVNRAIDRGVAYLKKHARRGPMGNDRMDGLVPLVGLTLLECGVPADDPVVAEFAGAVRKGVPGLTKTYSLSLAILFLDRLGNNTDRPLIELLAARLMAGQNAAGGWTYDCPGLSREDARQLLDYLASHPLPLLAGSGPGDPAREGLRASGQRDLRRAGREETNQPLRTPGGEARAGGGVEDLPGRSAPPRGVAPIPRERLPGPLRERPIVRYEPGQPLGRSEGGDNSNTQFAILGVWAARRHGVPVERSLAMIAARFRTSQNRDGSWGYLMNTSQRVDSMTCVGLLGLAVGRVTTPEEDGEGGHDPMIEKGLRFLGKKIGAAKDGPRPGGQKKKERRGPILQVDAGSALYYLWSLERVSVLYNLRTIAGKEWYRWGARLIVEHQREDGSWEERYGPSCDTCFALLFLKRVNVARDLTRELLRIGTLRDLEERVDQKK